MILTFANGNSMEVEDTSSIHGINFYFNTYEDLDQILSNFTIENMSHVTLEQINRPIQIHEDIIPSSLYFNYNFEENSNGEKFATISCREKTEMEKFADKITQLEEAVSELQGR